MVHQSKLGRAGRARWMRSQMVCLVTRARGCLDAEAGQLVAGHSEGQ